MKIFSKHLILLGVMAIVSLNSCSFLDVDTYFEDTFSQDSIFLVKECRGYLWNTKDFPDPGAIWGGSWNPGQLASDEMTARWRTSEFPGMLFSIGEVNERNLRLHEHLVSNV